MPLIANPGAQDPLIASERDNDQLREELRDGDARTRRDAALSLAGDADSLNALLAQLAVETDASVQSALFDAMAEIGGPRVASALVGLLSGENTEHRNRAVTLLQQMSEVVGGMMPTLLQDPDPDTRIMSLDVLRLLPHADAPVWLRDVLLRESHVNVVGVALDRLTDLGGTEHLNALHTVRARFADEPFITFAADLAIQRIEDMAKEAHG